MNKHKILLLGSLLMASIYATHELDDADHMPAQIRRNAFYYFDDHDECDEDYCLKRWALPISGSFSFVDRAFDQCSQSTCFSDLIFGGPLNVRDVYLFSKLCDDNKVRINNGPALAPVRGNVPVGAAGVPFGGFRDDLFTTLLAPTELRFSAEQREMTGCFSLIHRFICSEDQSIIPMVGVLVPIKTVLHVLDVSFVQGILFREAFSPDATQREDSIKRFFREFIDIFDFFEVGILNPKGLTFVKRQRKTGFGDISVFALLDFANKMEHADGFQFGVTVVTPSGGKVNGKTLWEPLLGNGGAYQIDLFWNGLFNSCTPYFNPTFRVVAEISTTFNTSAKTRLPKLKVQPEIRVQIADFPELLAPISFQEYYVDQFEEFDSTSAAFADEAVDARIRYGPKILFGFGNYVYDAFCDGLRVGVFYEYMHKYQDKIRSMSNQEIFNTQLAECSTDARAHTISWSMTYKFKNMFEFAIGGQHIVAGRNMPNQHEGFASFVLVF